MLNLQLDAARVAASSAFEKLLGNLHLQGDKRNAGALLAAVVVAVLPLDLSHLVSLVCGVAAYLLLQELQPKRGQVPAPGPRKPDARAPTAVPVVAPTFRGVGWEAEVAELLGQIAPSPEAEAAVAQIARAVKAAVCPALPKAEVVAFAAGSLANGSASSVAVPEVDVVIHASPAALQRSLQARWARSPTSAKLDARKLQKSAIRSCTDCLVGSGTFKFRRSAFQGDEPKVILIAPGERQNVPMNLFVNSAMPLHSAALITECGRLDPRARELILLVRRWAKDRSLCHAAKGHLSPYAWTLLAVFFLQAGAEGGSVLPPLEVFKASAGLLARQSASSLQPRSSLSTAAATNPASAAELFKSFLAFYAVDFDWRKEAVSVRLGRRAPPETSLPLHIVLQEDGSSTEVGPSIEDPFEASQNLGACTSAASLAHLHEELQRAHLLCSQGASLTRLLEPWAPPEAAAAEQGE